MGGCVVLNILFEYKITFYLLFQPPVIVHLRKNLYNLEIHRRFQNYYLFVYEYDDNYSQIYLSPPVSIVNLH